MVTWPPARMRNPALAASWAAYKAACLVASRPAAQCAYGDCPQPGWHPDPVAVPAESGVTWFFHCGPRHRQAWLKEQEARLAGQYVCSWCRKNRHDRCDEDGCACETCAGGDD
jgi:hypothetical protein